MEQTTIKLFSPGGIYGAACNGLAPLSFFGFRRMDKTTAGVYTRGLFFCDTVRGAEL